MMGGMNRRSVLTAWETLIDADVAAAGGDACAELLGLARVVRGGVDAIEAEIGSRLRQLQDTEGCAPVADQHSRCGGVSASEGRRKDRRAETIERAPALGTALATDLRNLLPLCSRHHHAVHESGFALDLGTDRTLTIRCPDGEEFAVCGPDVPSGRALERRRRLRAAA